MWKVAFAKLAMEMDPGSKSEVEEVCDQVTCARNALVRKEGFSPRQHVIGHDVRIPGSLLHVEAAEAVESALEQGETMHQRAHRIRMLA